MPAQTITLLTAGALLVHALGHIGVFAMLVMNRLGHETRPFLAARSWAFPSLSARTAMVLASAFYVLAAVGFVAAAMSSFGVLLPSEVLKWIAIPSAVVSGIGIVLFYGNWPTFNTLAPLALNVAIIVTQIFRP